MMLTFLAAVALQIDLGGGKPAKTELKIDAIRPERSTVKPGDVLKVAFDLEIPKGWHIYPTTPTSTGTPTRLLLEGVEIVGTYEEPKPKTKAKTEVIDAYDYHEGDITIAASLRVKADAKPGPLEIKGVLDYQICDAATCIPAKTKVSFTLTVQEKRKPAAEIRIVSVKPAKGEWQAGEAVPVAFEIEIPKGWHIYPTTPTTTGAPTRIEGADLEVAGPYGEPAPKLHPKDEIVDAYHYHEGTITLTAPLRLKAGVKPGAFEAKGVVDYQICSDKGLCIPSKTEFAFPLTVKAGQAPAAVAGPGASFLLMLGFAFLGGFILNIMPCVLPVLMNKLGSLVKQKDLSAGSKRQAALAFTAGVLVCLDAFGVGVVVLRSLGKLVGWGFQFQEPLFVISLATLIFVFALSLLGVFNVPALATGAAAQVARKEGLGKHFFSGLFVTLLATPCSAPLLGTAMGYAFTLPPWGILLFFTVVGLGLAFPFLLVGFVPALLRFMPRPGAWMEVFERATGFILLVVVVWLADTIGSLTGLRGMTGFLAFLTAVAFGAWIVGRWGNEVAPRRSRLLSLAAAALLAVVAGKTFLVTQIEKAEAAGGFRTEGLDYAAKIPWQPFSEANVAAVRQQRKPGFIDFTADW